MSSLWVRNHFPHKHWRWIKVQCKVLPLSPITVDETHVMMAGRTSWPSRGFPALIKDDLAACDTEECRWPLLALLPVHARPIFSRLAAIFRAHFTCFLCLPSRQLVQRTHLTEIMWTCACLHVHICCMQSRAVMSGTSTELKGSQGTGATKESGQHQLDICKMLLCNASLFLSFFFKKTLL